MKWVKKYWLALVLFGLSTLCILAYYAVGAKVDEQGFLREPFMLIPLALLFLLSAITALLVKMFDKR